MELSVVVATLNGRDALSDCLDALAAAAPTAEVVVANGPSADGTSGMVQDRDDVRVLLELADRNVNAARNAGAEVATGDVVAFVDERTEVSTGWADALASGLADSPVVTGPVRHPLPVGSETSRRELERVAGRSVTHFDGGNVAFARDRLDVLDGFDEYLEIGGARDAAHRLAGLGVEVAWSPDLRASRETGGPGPVEGEPVYRKYRALAYRLAKNYGPSPDALGRVLGSARTDGLAELRGVFAGEAPISKWVGDGTRVVGAGVRGTLDGLRARLRDRRPALNPNGISSRTDRVVKRYDWD